MQIDETDTPDVAEAARREMEVAKARLSDAADRVRHEARNAGSTIQGIVMDELDRRAAGLGQGMRTLAERMREAAEPEADGSVAPRLMSQAVDMIEDVSYRLEGSSAREITDKLSRFGRENPMTFMAACLATGVMAGRFLVASSEDQGDQWSSSRGGMTGYGDDDMGRAGTYAGAAGEYAAGRTEGDFGYGEASTETTGSEFRSGFYDRSEDLSDEAGVATTADWEGHDTPDSLGDETTPDLSRPGYGSDSLREGKSDV